MALLVFDATAKSGLFDRLTRKPPKLDAPADVVGLPADNLGGLVNYLGANELVELTREGDVVATERTDALKDAAEKAAPTEGTDTGEMSLWATGRQRRLCEFETLFDRAGLRLHRMTANPSGSGVIEGLARP